ncbi:SixA phosphatase family protein [Phenylobacterium sp.]|jgi:phosphohistidine phosphatase|uniref:SixA phosphatase family protein n=1 Tax=Phenylobacterium sp. TaxID=1871053 RepID=UPI0037847D6A
MDRLILFRHGKAEPDSASGEDFDRRLAPRGQRETVDMSVRLAGKGFSPDKVLVSTAARTRDTWAVAQAAFPDAYAVFLDELYLAEAAVIWQAAKAADGGTVMVVGHNPGLQELAIELCRAGGAAPALTVRAQNRFPTAGAAAFAIDAGGRPTAEGLFLPERWD